MKRGWILLAAALVVLGLVVGAVGFKAVFGADSSRWSGLANTHDRRIGPAARTFGSMRSVWPAALQIKMELEVTDEQAWRSFAEATLRGASPRSSAKSR